MDEINKRTGGERRRVDDFPKDYKLYARDPNRVYKKRVEQMTNGKLTCFDDLTGERFGRLVVEELDHIKEGSVRNRFYWLCKCDCGKTIVTDSSSLRCGHTRSCGCYRSDIQAKRMENLNKTHGLSNDPLYIEWLNINHRCLSPYATSYAVYSKYGICEEWKRTEPFGTPVTNLEPFFNFREWSITHGYKKGLTIDRINGWIGYRPDNCRWADPVTQSNNTNRNVWYWDGEAWLTISMICRKYDVSDDDIDRITKWMRPVKGYKPWTIHEFMTWIKDKDRDRIGKRKGANADKRLCVLSNSGYLYDTIVLIHKVAPPPDGGSYIRKGYKPDGQA